MNTYRNLQSDAANGDRRAGTLVKRSGLALLLVVVASISSLPARAQHRALTSFNLTPTSKTIAECLPDATARVAVLFTGEFQGGDLLDLRAKGLPPNTRFAVFLTELPAPPFGAAQYIGDFTTNAAGLGSLRVNTIIGEAFSTTLVGTTRVRKELNHMVIWFADPVDDDFCFGPGGGATTPFDGDGVAGGTVLSSASLADSAPLP
jgi:hypothetical protein